MVYSDASSAAGDYVPLNKRRRTQEAPLNREKARQSSSKDRDSKARDSKARRTSKGESGKGGSGNRQRSREDSKVPPSTKEDSGTRQSSNWKSGARRTSAHASLNDGQRLAPLSVESGKRRSLESSEADQSSVSPTRLFAKRRKTGVRENSHTANVIEQREFTVTDSACMFAVVEGIMAGHPDDFYSEGK
jgi:hypothetical protein